jgi:integrase
MASQYITVKKYAGVCYSESKRHKFRDRPDRVYWVRFRDKHGKLRYERCGRASEGWTAESAQRKRYEILEHDRAGKYKSKVLRKEESITLNILFDKHYLPWATVNKKRGGEDRYRYKAWAREVIGAKRLNEVGTKDIENIVKNLKKAGRAKATIRQVVTLINHIFNKATEWELWDGTNPTSKIKLPKLDNARQKFLTKEETDLLLKELRKHSVQIAQIAGLSLYTGMRRGEVFALRWQDISFDHKLITVSDSKNSESRHVFITTPVYDILKELHVGAPGELLFTNSRGEHILTLSKTFARVIKKLGFNEGVTDRRQRVSFHTLRHSFASWAVMNGVPLYHLAKALGHKSTAMTERYSHLAPESQRVAFEAVANFANKDNY